MFFENNMGERNFMKICQKDSSPNEYVNLEYLIMLDGSGVINKIREGGILDQTIEEHQYGISGRISLQPMNPERLPGEQDDSHINIEYYLGKKYGTSAKPIGDSINKFCLQGDNLKEMVSEYLPHRRIKGYVNFATVGQLPGDFTKGDFFEIFKKALEPHLKKLAKAETAFIESYGGQIQQYGAEE